MRGLYIHIPFCKHICNYCDFPKRIAKNENQINEYVNYLIKELDNYKNYYNTVKTIYIGGGTPNLLNDELLERLLLKIISLNISFEEFSIEINPELLCANQVKLFKKYGIKRVSIGVETFNDEDLKKLNRHHTKKTAIDAVNLLKENGINNINIDLMFAHPYDTLDKVKENIKEFLKLDVNHISYYSMILEEKTVFSHLIDTGKLKLLDEDLEAKMYEYIIKTLKENGFKHYETSNFARDGYESKHNLIYWNSLEYVGVGAGASGYLDSVRYTNNKVLSKYYNGEKETEVISFEEKKKEFMLLGFRKIDGVSISEYHNRFNSNMLDDFDLEKLISKNLIKIEGDMVLLTEKGTMLANEVFIEFV